MSTASAREMRNLPLPPECLEALRDSAYDGLKALPKRGAEVGGFIVGTGPDSANLEVVLVPSEHLHGPVYSLSEDDLTRLSQVALEIRSKGNTVAAFFRSCTGRPMQVEKEDLNAIAAACPAVQLIVLVAASFTGSAAIRMFSRDTDGAWRGSDKLVVPAFVAPLQSDGPQTPAHPDLLPADEMYQGVAGYRTREAMEEAFTEPLQPKPVLVSDRVAWMICAVAIALSVGAALYWYSADDSGAETRHAAVSGRPRTLGLGIDVQGNGAIRILWDAGSAAARSGVSATLDITDDRSSITLPLTASDLRRGWMTYAPESADLMLRLRVSRSEGPPAEEMLRVLGNQVVQQPVAAAPVTVLAAAVMAAPVQLTQQIPGQVPQPQAPSEKSRARMARPQVLSVPKQISVTPLADALAPEIGPPPEAALTASAILPLSLPPRSAAGPGALAHSSPTVSAPVPLHKVVPLNRGFTAHVIEKPVTVAVIVSVDEHGRVTSARIDDPARARNSYLAALSLSTARDWTFRPATRDGVPIPSEQRIEFNFRPKD